MGHAQASQAVWYLNDEVGSIVSHSDTPNVRMRIFIQSPACIPNDPDSIGFTVMWPIKEIKNKHGITRDYLQGFTEDKGFRSARLHSYFDIPTDYFTQ